MIELGKQQHLQVVRTKDFGVYLGEKENDPDAILLPKKQVPSGTQIGDSIEVFIYKDSSDRLIATTGVPKLQVGDVAVLEVKEVGKIGAFLDMGLEKDLLLPFREQTYQVQAGDHCLVALYKDKSSRLAATMKVYSYMSNQSPYQAEDKVEATVYEVNPELGAFVAVDNKYYGLISQKELFYTVQPGDKVQARVVKVRTDGKLDLSLRDKAYLQMDEDAVKILEYLDHHKGVIPFTDKADPDVIKQKFGMSKNAFKRAIGRLLKEEKIVITETTIEKL